MNANEKKYLKWYNKLGYGSVTLQRTVFMRFLPVSS